MPCVGPSLRGVPVLVRIRPRIGRRRLGFGPDHRTIQGAEGAWRRCDGRIHRRHHVGSVDSGQAELSGAVAFNEDMDFQGLLQRAAVLWLLRQKVWSISSQNCLLLPEQYRNYLMRIKVMELLLYLVGQNGVPGRFWNSLFRNNL